MKILELKKKKKNLQNNTKKYSKKANKVDKLVY